MKVITAIISGQQSLRMLRVTQRGIEVDHGVEVPRAANPLIYRQPVGLAQRDGMVIV